MSAADFGVLSEYDPLDDHSDASSADEHSSGDVSLAVVDHSSGDVSLAAAAEHSSGDDHRVSLAAAAEHSSGDVSLAVAAEHNREPHDLHSRIERLLRAPMNDGEKGHSTTTDRAQRYLRAISQLPL